LAWALGVLDLEDLEVLMPFIAPNSLQDAINLSLLPFQNLKEEITAQEQDACDVHPVIVW
jgi:hypothetical protein